MAEYVYLVLVPDSQNEGQPILACEDEATAVAIANKAEGTVESLILIRSEPVE